MDKQELILLTKKIDNISKYSIKGGTAMFNKEHPQLLTYINEHTKEIQKYSPNKKLVAKLIFLRDYDGDLTKIMYNNKIMIYDYKINSFKEAYINATQKQWDLCACELSLISETYCKEETINMLRDEYEKYLGKSGNRKLLRDNKKLYLSLFHHTSNLDTLNRNLNKFSMRLYILLNNVDIYCQKHKSIKFWRFSDKKFIITCNKCEPKYPSIDWFKKTYDIDWKRFYDERRLTVKNNKTNSVEWFKLRYGELSGIEKYRNHVINKMNKLSELKANRYSKISQELFWDVYNKLENKDKTYFHDLNLEFVLRIPETYGYNKTVMMLDFKQNNKIIEYNGNYWHTKAIDDIKYKILRNMGFDIMVVTSDEYNRDKKDEKIIEKCVNFLQ